MNGKHFGIEVGEGVVPQAFPLRPPSLFGTEGAPAALMSCELAGKKSWGQGSASLQLDQPPPNQAETKNSVNFLAFFEFLCEQNGCFYDHE